MLDIGLRVLKEVVLLYRKCLTDPAFRSLRTVWTKLVTRIQKRHRQLTQMCEYLRRHQHSIKHSLSCCISAIVQHLDMNSTVCNICRYNSGKCTLMPHHVAAALNQSGLLSQNCQNLVLTYSLAEKLSVCCHHGNKSDDEAAQWVKFSEGEEYKKWLVNLSNEDNDLYSSKNNVRDNSAGRRSTDRYVRHHLENLPRRLCSRLSLEKQQGLQSPWPQDLESDINTANFEERAQYFSQVGCLSNKSLNFYAMDSQKHWMFSDALGIEPNVTLSRPTAVLFDKENEQHFIMRGNLTVTNTMSFILDFEEGRLSRHKQSHSFHQPGCEGTSFVCVKELDSESFLHLIKEVEEKDIVILIYAHWCGFCQTVSHTFLSLAQYFAPSQHITFARINGAVNDLPWEYTFDSYPTVLFFPARRKADSVVFPDGMEMTLVNLVRFVLHHANYDTRLHLAADVCSKTCIHQNLRHGISLLQELKRKQARLQMKHRDVSNVLSPIEDGKNAEEAKTSQEYYTKLGAEFLSARLQKTQQRIESVKKLIDYLRNPDGGVISMKGLLDLFTDRKANHGG